MKQFKKAGLIILLIPVIPLLGCWALGLISMIAKDEIPETSDLINKLKNTSPFNKQKATSWKQLKAKA